LPRCWKKKKDQPTIPTTEAVAAFALGKCYDDSKDYDQAFPHFIAGCKLKRAKLSYDPASAARQFATVMEIFDRATLWGGPVAAAHVDAWRGL